MAEMDASFRKEETDAAVKKALGEVQIVGKIEVNPPRNLPIPRAALERFIDFHPGDSLSITLGQELYSPIKYATFTVGPFAATVVVRPDETGAQAAERCYRILLELNEAEFNIAWDRHRARLAKMPKKD